MIHILYVAFYNANICVCSMLEDVCMCAVSMLEITVQLKTECMDETMRMF